jgi:CRP-like cAMP-binding protein
MTETHLQPLIRKLETIVDLSDTERVSIGALPHYVRNLKAGQDIVREFDRPSHCCVILDGFAVRYKSVDGGKRQILSFHISGDMPDLHSLQLDVMDHSLATIVASRVAFIPHQAARNLMHTNPRIADAFWREALIDSSIFREWMLNIGQRPALARLAHVLCELYTRMDVLGLVFGKAFALPVTQQDLGDAMGISTVHVNRMMMELRDAGLVRTPRGAVVIENWDGLKKAGQFDPTYLHIRQLLSRAEPKAEARAPVSGADQAV